MNIAIIKDKNVTGLEKKTEAKENTNDIENGVLFNNDTGILGKRNSEFSQQEWNLRPSDY